MPGQQWLLGLLLVALFVQAAMAYRVYRRFRHADAGPTAEVSTAADREGTVECPTCGSENESGYRYCRTCIEELPSWGGFDGSPRTPLRQAT